MSLGHSPHDYPRGQASELVRPQERVSWLAGIGLGLQHLVIAVATTAIFARFMGLNLNLALLMSGVATGLALLMVRGKVPGYLGASVAFVPAIIAIRATGAGTDEVMGALLVVGLVVLVVGLVAHIAGGQLISALLPPPVSGAIMMVIGLNVAPTVIGKYWNSDYWVAVVTALTIIVIYALSRGFFARIALPLGLAVGVLFAWLLDRQGPVFSVVAGQNLRTADGAPCVVESLTCTPAPLAHDRLDLTVITHSPAWGVPALASPVFTLSAVLIALPFVVLVLAETTSHVKTVGYLLDHRSSSGSTAVYRPRRRRSQPLVPSLGRALMGVGVGTMVSTAFGGPPFSPDSQNVKAMASSRVMATKPLYIAAALAIVVGFVPVVGGALQAIPMAVIGGAALVLCGFIALLGARLWVDNRVDFTQPATVVPLAAGLVVALGDLGTSVRPEYPVTGVALATVVIVVFYHLINALTPGQDSPTHVVENSVDWQDTSPVSLIDLRQYERGQAGAAGYAPPAAPLAPPPADAPAGVPLGSGPFVPPPAQSGSSGSVAPLRMPGVPSHLQPGAAGPANRTQPGQPDTAF